MRVEISGAANGEQHMQSDVRSAQECLSGRTEPFVRLYWWSPPAISLGVHQPQDLIDDSRARIHGVDIVTRPTGGGAILHADELTYCVTLPLLAHTPTKVYAMITQAVSDGLARLGIKADVERWPTAFDPHGRYKHEPLCFSGIARNEIRVDGRKLVGSAQRIYRSPRGKRAILQHGSLLLSDAHAKLPEYLRSLSMPAAAQMRGEICRRSTSLAYLLNRRPDVSEVAAALKEGFEGSALRTWVSGPLTEHSSEVTA